jgi:hypothetical protein
MDTALSALTALDSNARTPDPPTGAFTMSRSSCGHVSLAAFSPLHDQLRTGEIAAKAHHRHDYYSITIQNSKV